MILDMKQQLAGLDGKAMTEAKVVTGDDGKPMLDEDGRPVVKQEPIILRTVCVNALMGVLPTDKTMTGDQKLAIFTLAQKITQEDTPDVDIKALALIKDRVGEAFGPVIVGPVFPMLNGTPASPKLADVGDKEN